MVLRLEKMRENCPSELKSDISEIVSISRDFMYEVDIDVDDELDEIKLALQMARNYLSQIFGRMLTIVTRDKKTDKESILDFGLKNKFEEDIGSVIAAMKLAGIVSPGQEGEISSYMKYSTDLQTAFDFIVFQPFVSANRDKSIELKQYMEIIFNVASSNASVLGYASKSGKKSGMSDSPSSIGGSLIPSGGKLIKEHFYKKNQPKEKDKVMGKGKKGATKKVDESKVREDLEEIIREQKADEAFGEQAPFEDFGGDESGMD